MTKRKILLVSLFAVIILLFVFFIAEIVKAPYNIKLPLTAFYVPYDYGS